MKIALLADVHANLEALDAVLEDISRECPGALLVCAGDVVGYGPDPETCLARLRDAGAALVKGNHEEMLLGTRDFSRCIYAGIRSALWGRDHLPQKAQDFLTTLPVWAEVAPGIVACHGDLESADHYLNTADSAREALEHLETLRPGARVLVCGHTHQQTFFSPTEGFLLMAAGSEMDLPVAERCLINPGSIGQERRERATPEPPLARYACLDLNRRDVAYRGIPYDHASTLKKMRRAGLVAKVVITPARGLQRHLERIKRSWALRRAAPTKV